MLGLPKVEFNVEKLRRLTPLLNNSGFAPIFMLLFLVLGIGLTTYVVQNRTNFLPFARTISSQSQSGGTKLTASADSCTIPSTQGYCEITFEWNTDYEGTVELVGGEPYGRTVVEKNGLMKLGFNTLDGKSETEHTVALRGDGNNLVSIKIKAIREKTGTQPTEEDEEADEEEDEEENDTQNALYQKCGFTKNESGIPVYAVAIGENENINDPECKDLIAKQTEYFGNKMEKARLKAEEIAKQNKLKYQQGVFVPDDGLSEEEQEAAKKKAEELNKTVAPAIKQAEAAQGECDKKEGQEKANCLKNVQAPVQKVMDEGQKAIAKGSLDKLKQIVNGERNGGCVKADLNLTPHLEAKRLKARGRGSNPDPTDGGESNDKGRRTFHRLLLCAGKSGDLKWRVLVGGEASAEDKGNDAERLYGLYGTDESYSGPPQFGSGFAINRCVTLTGNTKEAVLKDLDAYIKAAEAGESPKAPGGGPCKAEPNKNDTGGNGSQRRAGSGGDGTTPSTGDGGDEDDEGDTTPSGDEDNTNEEDKTGVDGGKTNKCTSDCSRNGEGFVCENGQCVYRGADCKQTGCPEGRRCHRSSGQCVKE